MKNVKNFVTKKKKGDFFKKNHPFIFT